jgi:DedD protein
VDRVVLKRLLGAGVVVALAVIVLPFILQGEGYKAALRTDIPPRPQPPQPLDTASREPPAEVRGLLEPPPPLPMEQASVPPAEPAEEAAEAGASKPATAPPAKAARPAPEASKPEVAPNAAAHPSAQPPQVAAKPRPGGGWVIQLGSFTSESNAQKLRGQVQRVGIPCQIEPLDIEGRKVWRVRAGPFASQAEADAALKRLQGGLKLGGMVMQVR